MKVLAINLLVLVVLIIIVELVFGSWLIEINSLDNLAIIRGENREFNVKDLYPHAKDKITYSRDRYGLRGSSGFNDPGKIDVLTMGGSTTDQRYIEDGKTWQDHLQRNLSDLGIEVVISNAGIDGHSTVAHIKSYDLWFPHIPDLRPKYVVYYIGINDFFLPVLKNTLEKKMKSRVKDKSVLCNLFRKIKGVILSKKSGVTHIRFNFSDYRYVQSGLIEEKEYEDFFSSRLEEYEERIEQLIVRARNMGAEPVFITQPTAMFRYDEKDRMEGINYELKLAGYSYNGVDYYHLLNKMNECIYNAAGDEYTVINLTRLNVWKKEDFYDLYHMTPQGVEKLAKIITPYLEQTLVR